MRDGIGGEVLAPRFSRRPRECAGRCGPFRSRDREEKGVRFIKSVVTLGYDHRDRLISESRTADNAYILSHTCDTPGNRLTKTDDSDVNNVVTTIHEYDANDPDPDAPTNNRLMSYGT